MKNNILKILLSLSFVAVLFSKPGVVKAQDLEVTCVSSGGCNLSSQNPLFSTAQDGFWYPGKSIVKTLKVTNNDSTNSMDVSTNAQNPQIDNSGCQLDKQLLLSITGPNFVSWAGPLNDFYQQATPLSFASLSPGSSGDFTFTITLPQNTGNECQNQTTSFDLSLNFSGEIITPAPGSSGSVSGAGAPICTDTVPGGAPTLTSAVAGINSVTLTWTPAPGPVSYYLITYGTSPGAQTYGNPNIGGSGTTSYTVSGLSGGITYYFRIRAGNGCMPGPFSNELSTGVGGGAVAGPAVGFAPGVLGVNTVSTPAPSPSATGKVQGLETQSSCVRGLWWQFLLLEAVVLILIYRVKNKGSFSIKRILLGLISAIIVYLLFRFANRSCINGEMNLIFFKISRQIFWLLDVVVFLLLTALLIKF